MPGEGLQRSEEARWGPAEARWGPAEARWGPAAEAQCGLAVVSPVGASGACRGMQTCQGHFLLKRVIVIKLVVAIKYKCFVIFPSCFP